MGHVEETELLTVTVRYLSVKMLTGPVIDFRGGIWQNP